MKGREGRDKCGVGEGYTEPCEGGGALRAVGREGWDLTQVTSDDSGCCKEDCCGSKGQRCGWEWSDCTGPDG